MRLPPVKLRSAAWRSPWPGVLLGVASLATIALLGDSVFRVPSQNEATATQICRGMVHNFAKRHWGRSTPLAYPFPDGGLVRLEMERWDVFRVRLKVRALHDPHPADYTMECTIEHDSHGKWIPRRAVPIQRHPRSPRAEEGLTPVP